MAKFPTKGFGELKNAIIDEKEAREPVPLDPNRRDEKGRLQKGSCLNPSGRPKRTEAEKEAIETMRLVTPEMVDIVLSIARNENASHYARLQAAELIMNRAMGRPESYLKVEKTEDSVEETTANLIELFAAVDKPKKRGRPPKKKVAANG